MLEVVLKFSRLKALSGGLDLGSPNRGSPNRGKGAQPHIARAQRLQPRQGLKIRVFE